MIKTLLIAAALLLAPFAAYAQESPEKVCNTPASYQQQASELPAGFLKGQDVLTKAEDIAIVQKALAEAKVPQDVSFSRIDVFDFANGATLLIFYTIWEDGRECAGGSMQVPTNVLYGQILRSAGN